MTGGRVSGGERPGSANTRCALLLVIVLALAASGLASCSDGTRDPVELDSQVRFSDLPAYAGVPFADALQAEQRRFAQALRHDPTTGTTSGTFHGRYTWVTDGVRRTITSECAGCARRSLWLVGGSVAFGLGQRDEHTVASDLVRLAAANGIDLDVTNLAVPGWTVWQSYLAVEAKLRSQSLPRPDVIVDIGGFNDTVAALVVDGLHLRTSGAPLLLVPSQVQRFEDDRVSLTAAGGAANVSRTAVRGYEAGRAQLEAVAREYGVATAFFFHPDALASPVQLAPVRHVVHGLRPSRAAELRSVLAATASALRPETVDLRDLYQDLHRSVFLDWAHTNERGAELLADAVYGRIEGALR